jgi:hypothetical protein
LRIDTETKNDPAKSRDSSMQGHIVYVFRLSQFALWGISGCAWGHKAHSHSTNPIIWDCIFYAFTGIAFANLLIFHLLFLAANFLSIKIVSQKAGEYNTFHTVSQGIQQ